MLESSNQAVAEKAGALEAPVFSSFFARAAGSFVVLLCALSCVLTAEGAEVAKLSAARRLELIKLVRNDCGSCHGMLLNGGLGPTLLPQALKEKPDASLVATILDGRNGTPMPPWRAFMTEAEAAWIVENLKQGFPDAQSK